MNFLKVIILYVFTMVIKTYGVGEGAVITLQFPAGAENTGLGETGVSIANTVNSVFWNPANVACLYEELYLNHIYSNFHEDLLPVLHLPELYHDFSSFSTTLNNIFPHIDLGYAYFRNFINMGINTIEDSNGVVIVNTNSDETVTSNSIGIRGFDILSFGVSFKRYNSRLAPGIGGPTKPDDGIAKGYAIDLGIRINKKFDILGLFYLNPAIGVSALNLGKDSTEYIKGSSNKEPLPRIGWLGGSCEANVLDLFSYTYVYELEYNLLKHPNECTKHIGHKFQITPFYSIIKGKMTDTAGQRYEKSDGYVVCVNLRKTFLMITKFVKVIDIINKTDNFSKLMEWDNSLTIREFNFKPNIYYSKSHSVISGRKAESTREGQVRNDWSIGFGIIGGFPDNLKKALKTKKSAEPIKILKEEDGDEIVN
jgi:hypothetical protein